jgi:N-carbamoylputrescine amidase
MSASPGRSACPRGLRSALTAVALLALGPTFGCASAPARAAEPSAPQASPAPQQPAPAQRTLRVALCQTFVNGDPHDALVAIDLALESAAAQGAQLAVFPETCLFGWVNPDAHALADPIPGPTTERLGVLAREHGLMLVVGLAERDDGRLFDSAVLIDRDGRLLLRHRKVNILTELMSPPYTPGNGAGESVVDTRLGRIGLLICADTFLDEVVAQLAEGAPDLVAVPYGWAAPLEDWPQHGHGLHEWVMATARRTGASVVGVDATGEVGHGPWKGYLYGGQSVACDRDGRVLAVLADRAPEVRVLDVPLGSDGSGPARQR